MARPNTRKAALSKKISKLKAKQIGIPKKKTRRKGGQRKGAGRPWEWARLFVGKEAYTKLAEICDLQELLFYDSTPPLDLLQEQIDAYVKDLDVTLNALKKEKLDREVQAELAAKG